MNSAEKDTTQGKPTALDRMADAYEKEIMLRLKKARDLERKELKWLNRELRKGKWIVQMTSKKGTYRLVRPESSAGLVKPTTPIKGST